MGVDVNMEDLVSKNLSLKTLKERAIKEIADLKSILMSDDKEKVDELISDIFKQVEEHSKKVTVNEEAKSFLNSKLFGNNNSNQSLDNVFHKLTEAVKENKKEKTSNKAPIQDVLFDLQKSESKFDLVDSILEVSKKISKNLNINESKFSEFIDILVLYKDPRTTITKILKKIYNYFEFDYRKEDYTSKQYYEKIIIEVYSNLSKKEYFDIARFLCDKYQIKYYENEDILAVFAKPIEKEDDYRGYNYYHLFLNLENKLNNIYLKNKKIRKTLSLIDYITLCVFYDFVEKSKASKSNLFIPFLTLLANYKYPKLQKELQNKKMLYTFLSKIRTNVDCNLLSVLFTSALLNDYVKIDSVKLLLFHINDGN